MTIGCMTFDIYNPEADGNNIFCVHVAHSEYEFDYLESICGSYRPIKIEYRGRKDRCMIELAGLYGHIQFSKIRIKAL